MKLNKLYEMSPLESNLVKNLGRRYLLHQSRRAPPPYYQPRSSEPPQGYQIDKNPRFKQYFGGSLTK